MEHTVTSPRVSVIIPVLDEAQNLPHILPYIPDQVHEVILIDGHSEDDTIQVARQLLADAIVMIQPNTGKGDALRYGIARSTGDIIVMLDADGSTDPREIPRFVAALLAGADFSKGSRYLRDGGSDDITRLRSFGNRQLTRLVNILFRERFTDLCYGYNAFWKESFNLLDITDCHGFEIETVLTLRALRAGLQIAEVPSYEHPRLNGASKLHAFADGWRILRMIIHEWSGGPSRKPKAARYRKQTFMEEATEPMAASKVATE
jgi:glycosyltransferase involved in cell wall biosynthesis